MTVCNNVNPKSREEFVMVKIWSCTMLAVAAVAVLVISNNSSIPSAIAGQSSSSTPQWDAFVDQALDTLFQYNPTRATSLGLHQYDTRVEDTSKTAIEQEITALRGLEKQAAAFNLSNVPESVREDQELLVSKLRGRLLDLEQIRGWERNPDFYSGGASRTIFTLISRPFAPPEERLRSVIAREQQIPKSFENAHQNLKNPPHIYTEIALRQLPGIISFFQKDVPQAFTDVKDQKLLASFTNSNDAVVRALKQYQDFLQKEVLAQSNGDFAIGTENYQKKLLYDEMVDVPVSRLLEIGYADMERNKKELKEAAAKAYPGKTVEEALSLIGRDHPAPDKILDAFAANFSGLRAFIEQHHIIRIPSPESPELHETPPFARALTFASMNSPGAFEKVATKAFFNVTLPEADWKPEQVAQHLEFFNNYSITDIAIHEAYPGHYTQFLYVRTEPLSKIRQVFGCSSNAEGWAHYAEQMMLEEGFGNGNPKLHMAQLQGALIRDARYIAGISMHTQKMTLEQATDLFEKQAYMPHGPALREAMRGTSDPTYLVYTLGKLEILKLRGDYQKEKGNKFSLEDFHTRFVQQGYPPIRLIRESLLGSAGAVL
jgi:uncharacterized protein (DUF885 family)